MNVVVQQARKTDISSFVKKAHTDKKKKGEVEMNNIDEGLDGLSLTGAVIRAITGMEYSPEYAWNIGLGYNKYGSKLSKSGCIDTYCIEKSGMGEVLRTPFYKIPTQIWQKLTRDK